MRELVEYHYHNKIITLELTLTLMPKGITIFTKAINKLVCSTTYSV
jgi:hypothetical protein